MLRASKKDILFRFDPQIPSYPLSVRSVGHYRLAPGSKPEPLRRKYFSQIFWTVKGSGKFLLKDIEFSASAGDLFYYLPGEVHDFRPDSMGWAYRWVTLDHLASAQWLAGFGLQQRPLKVGACPEVLFRRITRNLEKASQEGDRQAACAAHELLVEISSRVNAARPIGPLADRCRRWIDENFSNPALSIDQISEELRVHRTTLFRSFQASHGVSVSRYLQSKRIHEAIRLLTQSELQIQEVAWRTGFKDANYFARSIRQFTGSTPRELRGG